MTEYFENPVIDDATTLNSEEAIEIYENSPAHAAEKSLYFYPSLNNVTPPPPTVSGPVAMSLDDAEDRAVSTTGVTMSNLHIVGGDSVLQETTDSSKVSASTTMPGGPGRNPKLVNDYSELRAILSLPPATFDGCHALADVPPAAMPHRFIIDHPLPYHILRQTQVYEKPPRGNVRKTTTLCEMELRDYTSRTPVTEQRYQTLTSAQRRQVMYRLRTRVGDPNTRGHTDYGSYYAIYVWENVCDYSPETFSIEHLGENRVRLHKVEPLVVPIEECSGHLGQPPRKMSKTTRVSKATISGNTRKPYLNYEVPEITSWSYLDTIVNLPKQDVQPAAAIAVSDWTYPQFEFGVHHFVQNDEPATPSEYHGLPDWKRANVIRLLFRTRKVPAYEYWIDTLVQRPLNWHEYFVLWSLPRRHVPDPDEGYDIEDPVNVKMVLHSIDIDPGELIYGLDPTTYHTLVGMLMGYLGTKLIIYAIFGFAVAFPNVHRYRRVVVLHNGPERSWVSWASRLFAGILLANIFSRTVNALCDYAERATNTVAMLAAVNRAADAATFRVNKVRVELERWQKVLSTFSVGSLTDADRLLLIEIKTVLHGLYHLYHGEQAQTLEWASNFFVTRSDMVEMFAKLPFTAIAKAYEKPTAEVYVGGISSVIDADEWIDITTEYDMCSSNDEYLAQRNFRPNANPGMGTLLGSLFASVKLGNLTAEDIRLANNQFTFINNMSRTGDQALTFMQTIVSVIGRTLFNVDPFDPTQQAYMGKLVDVVRYANEVSQWPEDMITNRDFMMQIKITHRDATELSLNPRMNAVPRYLQQGFTKAHTDIAVLSAKATALLKGADIRIEPLHVMLTGPAEGGKSALINLLMCATMHMEGKEFDGTHAYFFNSEAGYWEGYNGQKFFIMDDLWKSVSIETRQKECNNIIAMVNTVPYCVDMAFAQKGTVYFNSEYIISSTNLMDNGIKNTKLDLGMTHNDAVTRRIHLVLHKNTKITKDVAEELFRVDKCADPSVVGKMLTGVEAIRLIHRLRTEQVERNKTYKYSPDRLNELGFEPHAITWREYTSMDLFLATMETGLYSWTDSSMYPYYIALLAIVLGAVYAAPVYEWLCPFEPQSVYTTNSEESGRVNTRNGQRVNWKRSTRNEYEYSDRTGNMSYQSNDFAFFQSASAKLYKSMMYVAARGFKIEGGNAVEYGSCQATHIKDGFVMVCAHWFLAFIDIPIVKLYVTSRGKSYEMTFPRSESEWALVEGEDVVMFKLPSIVPRPPALFDHFADEDNLLQISDGAKMCLMTVSNTGDAVLKTLYKAPNTAPVTYSYKNELFVVDHPIGYYDKTMAGDSGGMLLVDSSNGRPEVVGMHIGCSTGGCLKDMGVSIPVSKQRLQSLIDGFDPAPAPEFKVHFSVDEPESTFPLPILRKVPQSERHVLAQRTKFRKSLLFEEFGAAVNMPARLKAFKTPHGTTIDPLHVALAKVTTQHHPVSDFPPNVEDALQRTYPRRYSGSKILTIDEALNGIPGTKVSKIVMSTSAGYPFTVSGHGTGKTNYVKLVDNKLVLTDFANERVQTMLENVKNGKDLGVLWADSLKDETRPIDKVRAGKTRVISAIPLDYHVVTRMYFQDFTAYMLSSPVTKPVSVGINPHGRDWSMLYSRLSKHRGSTLSGDFSNFDGKLPKKVIQLVIKFINWWYNDGEENARIRERLAECVTDAQHIVFDIVYQAVGGSPSGHGNTSTWNSLALFCMVYHVLVNVMGIPEAEFQLALYGDDSVITTKRVGLRCNDLAPHFLDLFGMTYTHCSKVENDDHDTLETMTYLGRKFVAGKYAPLPMTTIIETLYWHKGSNAEVLLLATFESVLTELSHYPKVVFDMNVDMILRKICDKYPDPTFRAAELKNKGWFTYEQMKYDPKPGQVLPTFWQGLEFCEMELQSNTSDPRLTVADSRAMEFTDRAVNDATDTQEHHLGAYHDVAPITNTAVDSTLISSPYESFNMDGYDYNHALDRAYQVANYDWTAAQSEGTLIGEIDFPDVMFAQTFIWNCVDPYEYFIGALRASFRVTANQFLYGKLLICYNPNPLGDAYPPTDVYRASGYPHIIVSASAGEVAVFDAPFISPWRALNVHTYQAAELGRFSIFVLCPLTNIQGDPVDCQILVSAQFVNARVFFPNTIPPALRAARREAAIHMDEFELHSGKGSHGASKTEARAKTAAKSIASHLESKASGAISVKPTSFFQQYADTFNTYAAPIAAGLSLFGLSKPATLDKTAVSKINPYHDLNSGKGIDTTTKLAMDPENGISTQPVVGGVGVDEMELTKLIGTPQMVLNTAVLEATPAAMIASCGPFDYQPCFVDLVTRNFTYWHGSYKIKVYITASKFHSVKLAFWYTDDPTGTSTDYESCYNTVVDVQGDTEVEFTMAYAGQAPATPTNAGSTFGLACKVVSWSQPVPAVSAPVFLSVYKAAASDFRLGAISDKQFIIQSNPRADFAKDFPSFQEGMKAYNCEGVLWGEEYVSVREIVHRWMPYSAATSTAYSWFPGAGAVPALGVEMWAQFYRFRRGSMRSRYLNRDSRFITAVKRNVNTFPLQATTLSCPTNPLIEYETPYYSAYYYEETGTASAQDTTLSSAAGSGGLYQYKSAGDDISFHFIKAYPTGTLSTPTTYGIAGLLTWATSTVAINTHAV